MEWSGAHQVGANYVLLEHAHHSPLQLPVDWSTAGVRLDTPGVEYCTLSSTTGGGSDVLVGSCTSAYSPIKSA